MQSLASIVTSQSSFQEQDVSFTNRSVVEGVFSECSIKIIEGCTFNVFLNFVTSEDQVRVSTPAKKRDLGEYFYIPFYITILYNQGRGLYKIVFA